MKLSIGIWTLVILGATAYIPAVAHASVQSVDGVGTCPGCGKLVKISDGHVCPSGGGNNNAPRRPTPEEIEAEKRRIAEEKRKEEERLRRETAANEALSSADELYAQRRWEEADAAYARLLKEYGNTDAVRRTIWKLREKQELHNALDAARPIAAQLEKELEEKRKADEERIKNRNITEKVINGFLERSKNPDFDGTGSSGLEFMGGSKTLFEKGTKDSAPVDSRVKGPSRLDTAANVAEKPLEFMPEPGVAPKKDLKENPKTANARKGANEQPLDPKELALLRKPGNLEIHRMNAAELEALCFPKGSAVQLPADDDLKFLLSDFDATKGKLKLPENPGPRLYNPLRQPTRAELDRELDSIILERKEKRQDRPRQVVGSEKINRAEQFLSGGLEWADIRKEVLAKLPNLPEQRGPVFMLALAHRSAELYKLYGEAYAGLLLLHLDQCRGQYGMIADQLNMPLKDFLQNAQEDPALGKKRDEALNRVREGTVKTVENLVGMYKVQYEAQLKQLLLEMDPTK